MRMAVAFSLGLLLSGCATHQIHYYGLSAFPAIPGSAGTGPSLVVGRIATAQALQDGRIRYLEGSNEVGAYEYHRWTDPPGVMVRDALIHSLRASGRFGTVQASGTSVEGDYAVRGRLVEFAEVDGAGLDNPGIQTRVTLELELREVKTGKLIWIRTLSRDEPAAAKAMADVVRSLDQNLKAVLKDGVAAMEAAMPPSRP